LKTVVVLGSTGSIGKNAIDVLENLSNDFRLLGLSANVNIELALSQARDLGAEKVVMTAGDSPSGKHGGIEITHGSEAILDLVTAPEVDIVLNALPGISGLLPAITALENGKDLALANKESMVVAGHIVNDLSARHGGRVLPVDSEHSALHQCLEGADRDGVRRVMLTASGGPFLKMDEWDLERVTPDEALDHPTWNMGRKITVDSATLFNKGLEVIEAHWLFELSYGVIDVVVHPESIVHAIVEFQDGAMMAQMAVPDMRIPIQYALTGPRRRTTRAEFCRLTDIGELTFMKPDMERFPCLGLAYEAGRTGGTMPAVLNAADEVAVDAFLKGQIGFTDIPRVIEGAMSKHQTIEEPNLEDILSVDRHARESAQRILESLRAKT
jgi:1-deoxy-D-xylulose-5-phosphate reductoisomerase